MSLDLTDISNERLLRREDVMHLTALGSSTIYRRIKDGTFPRPVSLGPATVRWKFSEVQAWLSGLQPTVCS